MRKFLCTIAVLTMALPLAAYAGERASRKSDAQHNLAALFASLDLKEAGNQADLILAHNPTDPLALFVRMEVSELNARPDMVLDSALRLCHSALPQDVLKIASARVLKYAANSSSFHAILGRIEAAALQQNECATNLRLALVTAAADGDPMLDLNRASASAGVLTRWRIAGPFGRYSNVDFDQAWPPESDRFSRVAYGTLQAEEFFFRDGLVSLPDYFSGSGVYYAGSDMESALAQDAVLEVFSPGPYAVFLDGRLLLTHDARFAISSSSDSARIQLNAGKHRVVVKFTADAAPFRVAVHTQSKAIPVRKTFDAGPLTSYIAGLAAYLSDDLPGLERIASADSSRAMHYLRALLLSAIEEHSFDARAAWETLLPAPLARIRLAQISADGPDGRSYQEIAQQLPDSEAAQLVALELSRGEDSLRRLVALHPSCSHLSQALSFFAGQPRERQNLIQQLANCAPESLDYARVLSTEGSHKEAANRLSRLLTVNPLDRAARRLLIQELLLDGRENEAAEQAARLHEIAPNSPAFARIAASPYQSLDSSSSRAAGFTQQDQFYVPYRRNGLEIVRNSGKRHFSGGASVTLLSDKVIEIENDGSISIYTHRVTRLLNKDGIARFGEVLVPRGADLLELRTIKAGANSGPQAIIEPELVQQKSTVSMPALEAGDAIEEEFVTHYTDWDEVPEDAIEFTFGSFTAPLLYSRLVIVAPESLLLEVSQRNGAPDPQVEHNSGRVIRTWEQNNIAQTLQENDLPLENQLPYVALGAVENTSTRLRDELISATRIGIQVTRVLRVLQQPVASDFEKAQQLYRFVAERVQPTNAEWSANSAEDSLLNFEGSRTATLLALARASGLNAELILARKIGQTCHGNQDRNCYTVPLVRFTFASGKTLDADAESVGAFGAVPSGLDPRHGLRVPLRANDQRPVLVALTPETGADKSVAETELFLKEDGNLSVDLHIRLGTARGQQVRAVLQAADQRERQIFFDQLAIRIFPGATQVNGSSMHQDNPEQPLELMLHCQVPQFVHSSDPWEVDQMIPALGLSELYARTATRKFPLYIDSVLFETATFHLRLSPGLHLRSLPAGFKTRNEFGEYSVAFKSGTQEITIHREFRIPAQIISPQNYAQFAEFARQVDEAERGRIGLGINREIANNESR
jgi:cellulose synthase operon protein C